MAAPEQEIHPTLDYAQFGHQQNMLQDVVRTSIYQAAIMANSTTAFRGKLVLDVGAGSGILSYFAVQAGAAKVYAVEASNMAAKIQKLLNATDTKNPYLKNKIEVISSKIETPSLSIPKVDTLISEPIGVFLVHERMIESYLIARDRYLKPGGVMIPSAGNIYVAPFSDATLWTQTMAKVRFWEQPNFYGVDLSSLTRDAMDEIFGQPVVGNFDHRILFAQANCFNVNLKTITVKELQDFVIPISWSPPFTGLIHGIASWFDINLGGYILSTAPNAERTHWQQVRFLLKEPLAVNAFETVQGWLKCTVNEMRSYTLQCELVIGDPLSSQNDPDSESVPPSSAAVPPPNAKHNPSDPRRRRQCEWHLHEQTYNYSYDAFTQDYSKPEFICLYPPVDTMVHDSASATTNSALITPALPHNPPNVMGSGAIVPPNNNPTLNAIQAPTLQAPIDQQQRMQQQFNDFGMGDTAQSNGILGNDAPMSL
ncbi:hypothetical protein SeLEV6574_g04358 [Synchytrium endobioticum]|uniref:type I protein arginine methyltransferase n=1 Tax=Synchytrium endobioticum TaxID=286115 RepID=A0A507CZS4_9FUNG|nr:hypothetical protein SeLEV6574_g04358 [Synchytrium endobioticum]